MTLSIISYGLEALTPRARVRAPNAGDIARALASARSADAADALNRLEPSFAARVVEALPLEAAIEVFNEPELDRPGRLISLLGLPRAAAILGGAHPDRRAHIFRRLPDRSRHALAPRLSPSAREALEQLLAYPAHAAGGIMTTDFVSVPADWTVGQALRRIHDLGQKKESVYTVCILDPDSGHLEKTISLGRLIRSDAQKPVLDAARPFAPITVAPAADREDVARLLSKYDLLAVPVVAESGKVLGIVTVDDVIDTIIAEGTEDVQKFGGLEALDAPYLKIGFLTMIRKRAGWLCALFLSEMLTASAMQHYQLEIERAIVLALFIPLIMSSGGNSGSQATSLIIRALALREISLRDWWRIASRELPAGIMLGAILGLIGVGRIVLWQKLGLYDYGHHWPLVAATVGLALTAIVAFGSLVGSMLPFALKRLGFDPAIASAPFVATLVDVSGLVIYFTVAYGMLSGTLL